MNQRIKELAEQATFIQGPTPYNPLTFEVFDKEKFAELIIQECTSLLFDESERLYAYSSECNNMRESDDAELTAEKCMDNIKMIEDHFGVK